MKNQHLLVTVAGCVLPLAALATIILFKLPVNLVLLYALVLLCPISHLFVRAHDHWDNPRVVHVHADSTHRP